MNLHQKTQIEDYLRDRLDAKDFAEVRDMLDAASQVHPACSTVHEFASIPIGERTAILEARRNGPRMNSGWRP